MLSGACHELPPLPAVEPATSVLSFRRVAVIFAPDGRQAQRTPRPTRETIPAVSVPPYSRIIFRAGSVSVR
jgi:hypothetical protein